MLSYAGVLLTMSMMVGQSDEVTTTKPIHVPPQVIEALNYLVGTWKVTAKEGDKGVGTATWEIAWAKGKPCLHCTQTWKDANGTDAGAGIWGYDTVKQQLVYVQFYASGANATERLDVPPEKAMTARVWKGTIEGVSDLGVGFKASSSIERLSPSHFVYRGTNGVTLNGETLPDAEIHFEK